MSLIDPLSPTDLAPDRDPCAHLRFVAAWGAVPAEPVLHPPSLREGLQEALRRRLLEERPTPHGYALTLGPNGFLELGRPANASVPNERSRTYRLLAYLAGMALRPEWPRLRRCRSSVYVLLGPSSGRTALLYLTDGPPSSHLRQLLADPYLCGGVGQRHTAHLYFSPSPATVQLPAHVKTVRPPELVRWLERLRKRVAPLYEAR